MLKSFIISMGIAFILCSCYKEHLNRPPELLSCEISKEQPNPGDTITLSLAAGDFDGDKIAYAWESAYGTFISDTNQSTVKWIVPFIEGTNYLSVEMSDGKVNYNKQISVECTAFINDDFSSDFCNKDTSNTVVTWNENSYTVKARVFGSDYKYFEVPDITIEPPYAVYVDLSTVYSIPFFSSTDKYGIYLDFLNIGPDTLVKALWFRIYPTSNSKTWTINILRDNGTGSSWEEIANNKMGTGNPVSKQTGTVNKLKLVIESDYSLMVYNNDELIIATKVLADKYRINNIKPGLKLQKAGIRGSNGSVTIDNLLITHNTNLLSNNLFK